MAVPIIVKGGYVDILLGDGNVDPGPETFNPICGLTTRQLTQQVNTNDVFVPDCADPEFVPVRRLVPTGRQWDISGDGLLNLANWEDLNGEVGVTSNYRFVVDQPAGGAGTIGFFAGPAMVTNMQIGGTTGDGQFATVSLAIASDGEWTYTTGAQP